MTVKRIPRLLHQISVQLVNEWQAQLEKTKLRGEIKAAGVSSEFGKWKGHHGEFRKRGILLASY